MIKINDKNKKKIKIKKNEGIIFFYHWTLRYEGSCYQ